MANEQAKQIADEIVGMVRDMARASSWQPIETAPTDGTVMLGWFPYFCAAGERGQVFVMRWNDEKWASKPKPHFDASGWVWGVRELRKRQPTHWMPLPDPPAQEQEQGNG